MSKNPRLESQLFAEYQIGDFVGNLAIDSYPGLTELSAASLKATEGDSKAQRFDLISAIRGGRHVEIQATATTFRQRPTHNRRYLRLAADRLEERAPTWKGVPFLYDHNTYAMTASKGDVASSKLVQESANVASFLQTLHAVKPEAAIGFLDGTIRKFSISWFPRGAVLCSVHNVDVSLRDGCGCWPGDVVVLDGRAQTVEYVFSDYEGKETSGVVIPAVKDTSVEEVRAALAAELNLPPIRTGRTKESHMAMVRLAAVLGLAAVTDGDDATVADTVAGLQRRATTAEANLAERDVQLGQLRAANAALTAQSVGVQVNAILEKDGYLAGKLRYGRDSDGKTIPSQREERLRRIAVGPTGLADLRAELAEMPIVAPIGRAAVSTSARQPALSELSAVESVDDTFLTVDNPALRAAAEQTGQKVEDLIAFARGHAGKVGA